VTNLLYQIEDHFDALAARKRGGWPKALYMWLSACAAIAGDIARALKPAPIPRK
jgi:hypothetical protein